jgi:hypothetical protein
MDTSNALQSVDLFGNLIPGTPKSLYYLNLTTQMPLSLKVGARHEFRLTPSFVTAHQLSALEDRRIKTQYGPSLNIEQRFAVGRREVFEIGALVGGQLFPELANYFQATPSVSWEHKFGEWTKGTIEGGAALVIGKPTARNPNDEFPTGTVVIPVAAAYFETGLLRTRKSGLAFNAKVGMRPYFSPLTGIVDARLSTGVSLMWVILRNLTWSIAGSSIMPVHLSWVDHVSPVGMGLAAATVWGWGFTDELSATLTGQITGTRRTAIVAATPTTPELRHQLTDVNVSVLVGFVWAWGFAT